MTNRSTPALPETTETLEKTAVKNRNKKRAIQLSLAGLAIAAVVATPVLGSAASLSNAPFGIKAVNIDKPSVYAVKPFGKGTGGSGGGSTSPTTPPATTPNPEPTRAPDESPNTVALTIDTSLVGCSATTSGFSLNVATVNSQDPAKTPLPVSAGISWGDGSSRTTLAAGTNSHVYKSGKYNLVVDGTLGGFGATSTTAANCISRVDHIGENTGIVTLEEFLKGGTNVSYFAAPPTSLSNGTSMLSGATKFTGDGVETWVLPNLVQATAMFNGDSKFDGDLSNLNPKSLQVAASMFSTATLFTGKGLDKWNTSSFTNTRSMFSKADAFNKDIGGWDMSHVTDFSSMFSYMNSFNQDISRWNVGSGKSFHSMFAGAVAFNQPLDSWNMSSATSVVQMFMDTGAFNQDLNSWNMSNVTDMTNMFRSAQKFNGKIDQWKTAKVTNMFYMFWGTPSFKQDVSKWNVTNVTNWTGFYTNSLLKSSYPSYVPSKFQNSTGYSG